MPENFGFVPVMAITALAFFVGMCWRICKKTDNRYIPIICGFVGIVLGIVGRTVIDGFPVADPITAAAIGFVSGVAATGCHQIYKQLVGKDK